VHVTIAQLMAGAVDASLNLRCSEAREGETTMTSIVEPLVDANTMMKPVLMTSVIGTAIEWYDFFLYATASALVFANLFFPSFDPVGAPGLGDLAFFSTAIDTTCSLSL
jgi:hypothetical protein